MELKFHSLSLFMIEEELISVSRQIICYTLVKKLILNKEKNLPLQKSKK